MSNYSCQQILITLTDRLPPDPHTLTNLTLPLTAEERRRSRKQFLTAEGIEVRLHLARGTVLQHGDLLASKIDANATRQLVRVVAKPESVITVTAHTSLELLRAAYHLGNRHIPLEITLDYLRLEPDSVLADMLHRMGLNVTEEILPFQPEAGAYASHHNHKGERESSHESGSHSHA
jgi:urease accessory protein